MNSKKKFDNLKNLIFSILKRRQDLNFKQTHLGREIGISQKQYSRIETGDAVLKLQVFLQIAYALKINPCDLLEQSELLSDFPLCEKSRNINHLMEEITDLKKRNTFLEHIINKFPDKELN